MYLLKYRLADGLIVGTWHANTEDLLLPNRVEGDPLYGYLLSTSPASSRDLQERAYVSAGAVQTKVESTMTALPSPFAADGTTECVITVAPFVPCTLVVNGEPFALTTGDPTLILTADAPVQFLVTLRPLATHWAPALTVEAV